MTDNERREFLKVALVAMGAGVVGCHPPPTANDDSSVQNVGDEERMLKRAELVERLKKLAASEPPKVLGGAMCYEPGPPPERKEIPCTTCKQTMVVGEMDEILREYNVPLKRIQDQNVNVKLIFPKHCPECGFGLSEEKFQLEIKYPDQREVVRVELESAFDLELMALFLQGYNHYTELLKTQGMVYGRARK